MATLFIHAPDRGVKRGAKSFEAILKDSVGPGYAIWGKWAVKIRPGWTIVLLRADKNKKRAEGILDEPLVPTKRYVNGVQRYDVHIKGLTVVPFKKEVNFNRYGVAVIGDC
jgi:hypothetical protein